MLTYDILLLTQGIPRNNKLTSKSNMDSKQLDGVEDLYLVKLGHHIYQNIDL